MLLVLLERLLLLPVGRSVVCGRCLGRSLENASEVGSSASKVRNDGLEDGGDAGVGG